MGQSYVQAGNIHYDMLVSFIYRNAIYIEKLDLKDFDQLC